MQLMKILEDRERIIKLTGVELRKLQINRQKMQEQNKQLVQSNGRLFAEINASNENMKAIQHDLGCKNVLLKALQSELKSQVKVNVSEEEVKLTGTKDLEDLATKGQDADEQDTLHRRIHLKSLGPSNQVQSKEKDGNKRACVRRQSARFKSEAAATAEDFCVMSQNKLTVRLLPTDSDLEDGVASTVKYEDKEGNVAISACVNEEKVKFTGTDDQGELATTRGHQADKQGTSKRRIQSKSLGPSRHVQSKEKETNKRQVNHTR